MSADEPFLARWSRRKIEARDPLAPDQAPERPGPAIPEPERAERGFVTNATNATNVTNASCGTSASSATHASNGHASNGPTSARDASLPTPLPSLDSLRGLQSDYHEFLKPDVDPGLQRAALKKLFSDPHFNQMDGLDVYIDDYGKFEPMSAAVAASLAANKYLRVVNHLLSEKPAQKAAAAAAQAVAEDREIGALAAARDAAPPGDEAAAFGDEATTHAPTDAPMAVPEAVDVVASAGATTASGGVRSDPQNEPN